DLLRNYTDFRIKAFSAADRFDTAEWERIRQVEALQDDIWKAGMEYAQTHASGSGTILVVGALNEMFDIGTERWYARLLEVPGPIFFLLISSVVVSGFLVGHSFGVARSHHWGITLLFCFLVTLVVYTVLDMDQPRRGLIQERQGVMQYLRST